jgi:hypothetical protein
MEKVAVLPVPDWACAMTSCPGIYVSFLFCWCLAGLGKNVPLMTGIMARCWMAEGRSKP